MVPPRPDHLRRKLQVEIIRDESQSTVKQKIVIKIGWMAKLTMSRRYTNERRVIIVVSGWPGLCLPSPSVRRHESHESCTRHMADGIRSGFYTVYSFHRIAHFFKSSFRPWRLLWGDPVNYLSPIHRYIDCDRSLSTWLKLPKFHSIEPRLFNIHLSSLTARAVQDPK